MIELSKENQDQIYLRVNNLNELIDEWRKIRTLNISPIHEVTLISQFTNSLHDAANIQMHDKASFRVNKRNMGEDIFYFLHIPRCAGNSILEILREHYISSAQGMIIDPRDGTQTLEISHLTTRKNIVDWFSFGSISKHYLDTDLISRNGVRIFSAIRNPYSWLVSFYFFGQKELSNPEKDPEWKDRDAVLGCGNVRRFFPTWQEFFNFFVSDVNEQDPLTWMFPFRENPFFQLYDENGNLIPEKIIRVEKLKNGIEEYFDISLSQEYHLNKGSSLFYQDYYTPEMIRTFENKYGFLLEEFGYNFDGPIND